MVNLCMNQMKCIWLQIYGIEVFLSINVQRLIVKSFIEKSAKNTFMGQEVAHSCISLL